MFARFTLWVCDMRDVWHELTALDAERQEPVKAQVTYYGRLGEMGHADDRADDWPPCGTGT